MATKVCGYCKSTYVPQPKQELQGEELAAKEREKQERILLMNKKKQLKNQIRTFSGSKMSNDYLDLLERFYKLFT